MTQEIMLKKIHEAVIAGQYDDAKAMLLDLNKQSPNNPEVLHQLAFIYMQQEQLDSAEKVMKQAIGVSPDSHILINHLGSIYRIKENFVEAEKCYQKALSLKPNYAEGRNNYGLLFYALNQHDKAVEQFTLALKANPHYIAALYNLALSLEAQKKTEEAIGSLLAVLDHVPEHIRAHFLLGKLLVQKKLYEDAEDHFQEIIKLKPSDSNLLTNIINCFLKAGRPTEAKQYCEKLIKIQPKNIEGHYNLGVIAVRTNEKQRAIEHYHAVLQIQPEHFATLNNIAILYLEKQNFSAAEHYFQQALKLQPDNQAIQYTLQAIKGGEFYKGAPQAYIQRLFDQYADHFDQHLQEGLDYSVPKILKQELEKYIHSSDASLTILDLGCGTGLMGELLKPWAKRLVGVDLSPKMVEWAQKKTCYNEIAVVDNVEYLMQSTEEFDLIVAADVFVYQGDLKPVMMECYKRLIEEGLLAFTVEIDEGKAFTLQKTGRFTHSKHYIEQQAKDIGYRVLTIKKAPTRSQYEDKLAGYYVILQKKGFVGAGL